jgi:hypothetical protein
VTVRDVRIPEGGGRQFTETEVTLGLQGDEFSEVLSGLSEGQTVGLPETLPGGGLPFGPGGAPAV